MKETVRILLTLWALAVIVVIAIVFIILMSILTFRKPKFDALNDILFVWWQHIIKA